MARPVRLLPALIAFAVLLSLAVVAWAGGETGGR